MKTATTGPQNDRTSERVFPDDGRFSVWIEIRLDFFYPFYTLVVSHILCFAITLLICLFLNDILAKIYYFFYFIARFLRVIYMCETLVFICNVYML
jgi:hypothetical protein